ncbi:hypothetical protein LTR37_001906 [Vermiconidia calcicola]|uniref:Uncharacterized protein n=1 Tax=Vermiconidia calcicola TaxID=1690605 RepID=A0ACC3NU52_9PEZI|nr:hypothetical protein LTR37_001906 [Vermiconidia calcicola]
MKRSFNEHSDPTESANRKRIRTQADKDINLDGTPAIHSKQLNELVLGMKESTIGAKQRVKSCMEALPAELRTLIYQYGLTEDDEIAITRHLKQPPLLRTCCLVRNEALQLWYTSNTFIIYIPDCDDTGLHAFERHLSSIDAWLPQAVEVMVRARGNNNNWDNLMRWCHRVWKNEGFFWMSRVKDNPAQLHVMLSAMEQASKTRRLSWEECESLLASLRPLAGLMDEGWLK